MKAIRTVAMAVLVSILLGGVAMAQTQVISFPRQNRSGTQQTPWGQLPATGDLVYTVALAGDASNAVLSDPSNAIDFIVFASPDGTDATQFEIQRDGWTGGIITDKHTGQQIPTPMDFEFGPLDAYAGYYIKLQARFYDPSTGASKTIRVGATLTANPPK